VISILFNRATAKANGTNTVDNERIDFEKLKLIFVVNLDDSNDARENPVLRVTPAYNIHTTHTHTQIEIERKRHTRRPRNKNGETEII